MFVCIGCSNGISSLARLLAVDAFFNFYIYSSAQRLAVETTRIRTTRSVSNQLQFCANSKKCAVFQINRITCHSVILIRQLILIRQMYSRDIILRNSNVVVSSHSYKVPQFKFHILSSVSSRNRVLATETKASSHLNANIFVRYLVI